MFLAGLVDGVRQIIILAGHYDTLFRTGFVGANDGGSSTGILLAFADALKDQSANVQVWLVWTDLEEAVVNFTDTDGLYGSRHLAARLRSEGLVPRIKGFFLFDMVGDKDLHVTRETQSTRWLQDVIEQAATQLRYRDYFSQVGIGITDDHVPFIEGRHSRGGRGRRRVRADGAALRRHGRVPPCKHGHDGQAL